MYAHTKLHTGQIHMTIAGGGHIAVCAVTRLPGLDKQMLDYNSPDSTLQNRKI